MVNLSQKQRRIVEAKLEGRKNKEIGKLEYPNATPESQAVLVSRELKKPNVAQYHSKGLSKLLEAGGVTKNQYILNIGQAMQANKVASLAGDFYETEIPDYTVRLQANKQAERFLKFEEQDKELNPELSKALKGDYDEVQLVRLMKNKD